MRLNSLPVLWRRLAHHEQVVLSILAILVGVIVAYAAIGFRLGIGATQWLGFGFAAQSEDFNGRWLAARCAISSWAFIASDDAALH